MRNAVLGAVMTILAAATGCSAEPATLEVFAPTTTSAVPTTTSVTPAAMSKQEAAVRYLAIVKPYNDALEALEQGINAGRPIVALRSLAETTATTNRAQIAELRAVSWPADIIPAMETLLAESELAQPHWENAARATTRNALAESVLAAAKHDGSEAAATIRTGLALDQYDEGDYGG
jgi:hypothetical protein